MVNTMENKRKMFYRLCPNPKNNPKCLKDIGYGTKKRMMKAEIFNRACRSCNSYDVHVPKSEEHRKNIGLGQIRAIQEGRKVSTKGVKRGPQIRPKLFFRNCPNINKNENCLKVIGYISQLAMQRADKKGYSCTSCTMKGKLLGNKNPMFGRKNTEDERKRKSESNTGSGNPMYGKSVYDVWLKKYGLEEADKRLAKLRIKHSKNNSGERNPMFGRPSPNIYGKGISGYHVGTGLYFRSSCEANFIISNPNFDLVSGESEEYCCNYTSPVTGRKRCYLPDFFDSKSKTLFEIKRVGWREGNSEEKIEITDCKIVAAEKMCKERDWKYFVREIDCIHKKKMFKLRLAGIISLDPKWEDQFQKWLELRNVSSR